MQRQNIVVILGTNLDAWKVVRPLVISIIRLWFEFHQGCFVKEVTLIIAFWRDYPKVRYLKYIPRVGTSPASETG